MRKVFAILDIETITDARLAFDVAWIVCDSHGAILEHYNALVSEIANAPFGSTLIARDSFMRNKSDFYRDALVFHSVPVKSFAEIAADFAAISDRYNARTVMCAYNARFDFSVLNDNANMYYGKNFFSADVEIVDIMTMALATICDTNKYVRWCLLNGFTTEKGNVKTNAETVYAYLMQNKNYTEAHHALQDCEIEADIYFKARKRKQKHHKHFAWPVFSCEEWHKVQNHK
jgi:DNA polymerase III epsilon subunit-like protein